MDQSFLHGPDGELVTEIPIRFLLQFRISRRGQTRFLAQLKEVSDQVLTELKKKNQKLNGLDHKLTIVENQLHELCLELRQIKRELKPEPHKVINHSNELNEAAADVRKLIESYRESEFIIESELAEVNEEGVELLTNELNRVNQAGNFSYQFISHSDTVLDIRPLPTVGEDG